MNSASDKGRQNEMSPRLSTLWNGKKLKILLRPSFACLCVLVSSRCLQRCVCVWEWVGALVGSIGVINLFVRVCVCVRVRECESFPLLFFVHCFQQISRFSLRWMTSAGLQVASWITIPILLPPLTHHSILLFISAVSSRFLSSANCLDERFLIPATEYFFFSLVYSFKYGYFVDSPLLHNKQAGKLFCLWKVSWLLFAGVFAVCSSSY